MKKNVLTKVPRHARLSCTPSTIRDFRPETLILPSAGYKSTRRLPSVDSKKSGRIVYFMLSRGQSATIILIDFEKIY